MMNKLIYPRTLFILTVTLIWSSGLFAQATGTLSGKIVDAETGDPLIGVNVLLVDTMIGAATDINGEYRVEKIPPGTYTLTATYIGYSKVSIQEIIIKPNKMEQINFSMGMQALQGEEVVVTAKAVKNTEAVLLKDRQKARAVSDAISAEVMSQSGSGNAAEAMKQVTGASVVDGKHVFVRGLGDRYTSTQLNGAEIPSADPYKRSGSVDLIPSNLIDNIVTVKSFTPDKPGNFSGGTVDIKTKDFPDVFSMSFSASTSYNSQATFNDNVLQVTNTGNYQWLGMDDGSMNVPSKVGDALLNLDAIAAKKSADLAHAVDEKTRAFHHSMSPVKRTAPMNQSYSFSLGNQVKLFGKQLGYLASMTYDRSHENYTDGVYARYALKALSDHANGLQNIFNLSDHKSTEKVLWGATLKSSFKLNQNNVLSFTGLYNQNGVSAGRIMEGPFPYDLSENWTYKVHTQQYSEQSLGSFQLDGDHQLDFLFRSKITWKTSYAKSRQNEPDLRYFTSYVTDKGTYGVKTNIPQERFFRYLNEDRYDSQIDITLPFTLPNSRSGNIKFGGSYAIKTRDFNERRFVYSEESTIGTLYREAKGDLNALFNDSNLGIVGNRVAPNGTVYYRLGMFLQETPQEKSNYTGDQAINAYYLMFDMPLIKRLRFTGGARYETTKMNVVSEDPDQPAGKISTYDLLPSVNFIYTLNENMNARFVYGRTLARPTFREISNFASYDFKEGDKYIGNPDLERTLIDNFDLRWEWFSRPGEIYAVSVFYKRFYNPIELVIKNNNYWITWQNVDDALTFGAELEARKKLDVLYSKLANFTLGGNLSLIHSSVDIGDRELEIIRQTKPDAESTRPFQGQSPYLLNLNLSYDNMEKGLSSSIYYNIFGERLAAIGKGGTPDVYEQPASMLNFSLSKKIIQNLSLKLAAKNILDSKDKKVHEYKGKEYVSSLFQRGRSFSLGLKYDL